MPIAPSPSTPSAAPSPGALPQQSFQSILIYGMGMMGTSLGLALRRASQPPHITGVVRSRQSADYLERTGAADRIILSSDHLEIDCLKLSRYDLIVLGLPIASILELIPRFPGYSGLITDLSSAHLSIAKAFQERPDLLFIGSHPLCGLENRGPQAAKADLFQGSLCFIIEDKLKEQREAGLQNQEALQAGYDRLVVFWKSLGMTLFPIDAAEHDQVMAYLSHLPHLLSSQLSLWALAPPAVDRLVGRIPFPLVGGGFQDMARIAGSNPEMWTDIVLNNRENLQQALKSWIAELSRLERALKREDASFWKRWLAAARQSRNRLCGYPPES